MNHKSRLSSLDRKVFVGPVDLSLINYFQSARVHNLATSAFQVEVSAMYRFEQDYHVGDLYDPC